MKHIVKMQFKINGQKLLPKISEILTYFDLEMTFLKVRIQDE